MSRYTQRGIVSRLAMSSTLSILTLDSRNTTFTNITIMGTITGATKITPCTIGSLRSTYTHMITPTI